ncbi:hypothetical protein LXL04_008448 [Taraxacum kok-saghyz]
MQSPIDMSSRRVGMVVTANKLDREGFYSQRRIYKILMHILQTKDENVEKDNKKDRKSVIELTFMVSLSLRRHIDVLTEPLPY